MLPEEDGLAEAFANDKWRIQLTSATVELAFAPEERDVYSYERTHCSLAPLGAKPGSGTNAKAANGCAPTELRGKERAPAINTLAPMRRSDK